MPVTNSHIDAENSREQAVTGPDGTTYRVCAVKKGMWLRGDIETGPPTSVADIAFKFLVDLAILLSTSMRASGQDTWKVGAFRLGRGKVARLVHKELLPPDMLPEKRMSELVEIISSGRTDFLHR
jgi:hypothetical protein